MPKTFSDEFFEKVYFAEYERKDKHDSADTFLLAVLGILGGILLHYLRYLNDGRIFNTLPSMAATIVSGVVLLRTTNPRLTQVSVALIAAIIATP